MIIQSGRWLIMLKKKMGNLTQGSGKWHLYEDNLVNKVIQSMGK